MVASLFPELPLFDAVLLLSDIYVPGALESACRTRFPPHDSAQTYPFLHMPKLTPEIGLHMQPGATVKDPVMFDGHVSRDWAWTGDTKSTSEIQKMA